MHKHKRAIYLSDEEAEFLSEALEQHIEGLEHAHTMVCEDRSLPDVQTLLEITATVDREKSVLQQVKGRIHDLLKSG